MNVRQLIEELQAMPQDAEVWRAIDSYCSDTVEEVRLIKPRSRNRAQTQVELR